MCLSQAALGGSHFLWLVDRYIFSPVDMVTGADDAFYWLWREMAWGTVDIDIEWDVSVYVSLGDLNDRILMNITWREDAMHAHNTIQERKL